MKVEIRFTKQINQDVFVNAAKRFMGKVVMMKKYKITYILGSDIRIGFAYGNNSNEALIKFMLENKSVTDVKKIEEVAE